MELFQIKPVKLFNRPLAPVGGFTFNTQRAPYLLYGSYMLDNYRQRDCRRGTRNYAGHRLVKRCRKTRSSATAIEPRTLLLNRGTGNTGITFSKPIARNGSKVARYPRDTFFFCTYSIER